MTVEREEPGLLVATCDSCGDTAVLNLDPDSEPAEVDAELEAEGWSKGKPDTVRFRDGHRYPLAVAFAQDRCPDCQTPEPKPAPKFGAHRKPQARVVGDDPVDEWPRGLVWEAAGLRPACGHQWLGPVNCEQCEQGYPLGEIRPWWRR